MSSEGDIRGGLWVYLRGIPTDLLEGERQQIKAVLPSSVNKKQRPSTRLVFILFLEENIFHKTGH